MTEKTIAEKTELVDLDISDLEQEEYIKAYIQSNMRNTSYEQFTYILSLTDSLAEASKAAILNEFINEALEDLLKNSTM